MTFLTKFLPKLRVTRTGNHVFLMKSYSQKRNAQLARQVLVEVETLCPSSKLNFKAMTNHCRQ